MTQYSLLLAFGKRRFELDRKKEKQIQEVLARYKAVHLDLILVFIGIAAIVSILFILSAGGLGFLTVPFVCFGVIRYLYLVKTLKMVIPGPFQ
jgi:hypothetical protein